MTMLRDAGWVLRELVGPPLFEREEELSRLDELFAKCARGTGAVAVVGGAVGIGKTALLHAAAERVADAGGLVLGTTGVRAERTVPLGVISELFWSTQLPAELAPRIGELLGAGAVAAEPSKAGPDAVEPVPRGVLHGMWTVLRELATDAPVLATVDDVHYADAASLQCLLYFVRRVRSSRILLVLAESEHSHRDNPLFRTELLRDRRCQRIHLGRLSAHGVGHVSADLLDADRAAELAAYSGGNPLLVRALLADQRVLGPARPGPATGGLHVGDAFSQAVVSCVHRVEPTMLAAALGLALLGGAASPERLAQLLDIDGAATGRALRGLEDAGLLDDGKFRHPAAAAAVLYSLPESDRCDGHRRIARLLHDEGAPATAIARHLVAAGHVDDDWALPVLREAAQQARLEDALGFAVDCLELAAAASASDAERATVMLELARVQWRVNPAAAARHLAPLTKALLDGHLPAGEAPGLAKALLWHGRADSAAEVLGHSEAAGADLLVVDEWLRSCWPELRTAPVVPAERAARCRQLQAAAALTEVLTRGRCETRGDETQRDETSAGPADEEASDPPDPAVAMAELVLQCGWLDDEGPAAVETALLALVYADRPDLAAQWCGPLIEQATASGAATWQARLTAVEADIALRQGDAPEAGRLARAALSLIPPRSWGVAIGAPLATLVLALLATGQVEEAEEQLNQPVPPAMGRTRFGLLHRYARGRHHLATKRLYAALADFLACGELMSRWGMDTPTLVPWRAGAAAVHLSFGDRCRARRLAEEQLALPGAGRPRTRGASLRVLAAASEPGERPLLLGGAIEALQASGDRLELAGALADLSGAYEELGDAPRALDLAERAVRLAEECKADPLVRAIRPNGVGMPGGPASRMSLYERLAVLSDAERRVASLVAKGQTNREVSQSLFITVSTVEQHLTRIYRKLNVSGRSDLSVCLDLDLGVREAPLGACAAGNERGGVPSMDRGFDQYPATGRPGG